MKQEMLKLLKEKSEMLLAKMDVELVDFEIEKQGSKRELVFYIYHQDGTGIELCEEVSHQLEEMIELDFSLDEPYHLVVSSPDLTRPLKTDSDLKRNLGKLLELKLRNPIEKQYYFVGKLLSFDDNEFRFESDKQNISFIKRTDIKQVKVYIDF